jgi:tRNA(adenine34) deaminase
MTARTTKTKKHTKGSNKRWVAGVKTVSTFPPRDTFNQDAETVARTMASKKVSPKGIGSGIRMIQYFINRAGKNLSATRKRELEKAKRILQDRAKNEKAKPAAHRRQPTRSR